MAPNLVYAPKYVELSAHDSALLQIRERNQDTVDVISVYGMITSKAMKIIWFMSSSSFASPHLGCYICGFINYCTQPVGGTGEDDFSQPFTSFSPSGLTHHFLRMLNSLWVLRTPYSSCWFCLVSSVQSTTHGVRMEISREVSWSDLWSIP